MFTARGAPKAKEFKIATVNNKARTVTLTGHGKKYSNISWDKLS